MFCLVFFFIKNRRHLQFQHNICAHEKASYFCQTAQSTMGLKIKYCMSHAKFIGIVSNVCFHQNLVRLYGLGCYLILSSMFISGAKICVKNTSRRSQVYIL